MTKPNTPPALPKLSKGTILTMKAERYFFDLALCTFYDEDGNEIMVFLCHESILKNHAEKQKLFSELLGGKVTML